MTTYTIDRARAAAQKRISLLTSALIYGVFGALALAVANRGDFSPAGLRGLAIGAAVEALMIGLLLWSSARSYDRQVATLQISLDDQAVQREGGQLPPLALRLDEVTRVEEYPGMGLLLRGPSQRSSVFLPELLTGYDSLRAQVAGRWPLVRRYSRGRALLYGILGGAAPVALFAILWSAPTRSLVLAVGALIVAGAIGLAAYLQRRQAPAWFKVVGWLMIPLMIVVVLLRLRALP